MKNVTADDIKCQIDLLRAEIGMHQSSADKKVQECYRRIYRLQEVCPHLWWLITDSSQYSSAYEQCQICGAER